MMITIGWIASFLLAVCGLPQSILSIRQGHSCGVTWGLLILWFVGESLQLIYAFSLNQSPIIFNCVANILFISIVIYYKIFPRNECK